MSDQERKLPDGMKGLAGMFCGCCSIENTWDLILDELQRLGRLDYLPEDGLAAAIVDHLGLSEHGTSIRGGWLTKAGDDALAFLTMHGTDWARNKGYFVDSEGVTHGSEAS